MFFLKSKQCTSENIPITILDNLPSAVFYLKERIIVYANKAAVNMSGFKVEELVGKDIKMLYRTEEEYEANGKQIYEELKINDAYKGMFPFRRKNGQDITCEMIVKKIGVNLEEKKVVVVFNDITNEIATEKEVSESEERYKNLLENTHDIIISISPEGKFVHVNTPWFKTFGYTLDELSTLKIENIVLPENLPIFNDQFNKALKNEPTENLDISFKVKDGSIISLEGNLIPKSFRDKVVAVLGFYQDVTSQKKDQEEIKNKVKELEKFNRLVVDREIKMIELKETIKNLKSKIK